MKQHKNSLSNRSIKRMIGGKYNKVTRTKPAPDLSQSYEMRPDGWRRKKKK
jgi:hypothetical protein